MKELRALPCVEALEDHTEDPSKEIRWAVRLKNGYRVMLLMPDGQEHATGQLYNSDMQIKGTRDLASISEVLDYVSNSGKLPKSLWG